MKIYNDLDNYYKDPIEAVRENQTMIFHVQLPVSYKDYTVAMVLHHNSSKNCNVVFMKLKAEIESGLIYEGYFSTDEIGVWWYNFKINKSIDNVEYITPGTDWEGILTGFLDQMLPMERKFWRFSVYKKDFETPSWIQGGVVYQIFPDRFNMHKGNILAHKEKIREHSWSEFPCWDTVDNFMDSFRDFYGGTLKGISEKIEYLQDLGVTCIYLNPIFESASSHRYNTADYEKIDSLLGESNDFIDFCNWAEEKGIKVILDGVFSHSGSDSKYFDIFEKYNENGAYHGGESSDYYHWYQFYRWPQYYKSWWNYDSLPKLRLDYEECRNYFLSDSGIVSKWLDAGASGWRLDAVDDLPDYFLTELRACVKKNDRNNLIVGEVWHDASLDKYVEHDVFDAKFLYGEQLDTVTNYQFRDFILEYVFEKDAKQVISKILRLISYYPKPSVDILWNMIGSHDTARILTILGKGKEQGEKRGFIEDNYWLKGEEKEKALKLMEIVSLIQYTLPGVPCVYYGDEVGIEGYNDPYNRAPFPWNDVNVGLLKWYIELGKMRKENVLLKSAKLEDLGSAGGVLCYCRKLKDENIGCYFNVTDEDVRINNNIDMDRCNFLMGTHFKQISGDLYVEAYGKVIFKKM